MTRSITAAVSTELQQPAILPLTLVHFAFATGSVRICDDIRDIDFNGDTYSGVGNLGKVSAVRETAGLRANGVRFSLSGIPTAYVDEATGQHYQGRTVEMWKAFLDSGDALIADPVKIFAGRIDQMVVTDGGSTAEITLSAENRLVDLVRPLRIRFYTDQDQQQEFFGDVGCEFVTRMQEKPIIWGRAKLTSSPGAPSSSDSGGSEPAAPTPGAVPDFGAGGDSATRGAVLNDQQATEMQAGRDDVIVQEMTQPSQP